LGVTHSLTSSIILTQKSQQPHPVLDYVLPFISNISFYWTLGDNTSYFGRNILLSTLFSRTLIPPPPLQRDIPTFLYVSRYISTAVFNLYHILDNHYTNFASPWYMISMQLRT